MTTDNKQIITKITEAINALYEEKKEDFNKKDLENVVNNAIKEAYENIKVVKGKKPRKTVDKLKKDNDDKPKKDNDDKPKKELTAYQIFMKEQMGLLKAREDAKPEGDEKKKPKELMKEIGELWKKSKA